jgi:hypothetical protein
MGWRAAVFDGPLYAWQRTMFAHYPADNGLVAVATGSVADLSSRYLIRLPRETGQAQALSKVLRFVPPDRLG